MEFFTYTGYVVWSIAGLIAIGVIGLGLKWCWRRYQIHQLMTGIPSKKYEIEYDDNLYAMKGRVIEIRGDLGIHRKTVKRVWETNTSGLFSVAFEDGTEMRISTSIFSWADNAPALYSYARENRRYISSYPVVRVFEIKAVY